LHHRNKQEEKDTYALVLGAPTKMSHQINSFSVNEAD